MMNGGLRPPGRRILACLIALFMLLSGMGLGSPGTVWAKTDTSEPATCLEVTINQNGSITPLHSYTIAEMQALSVSDAVYYSSIDSMPAPNITIAQGVLFSSLLADINQKYDANVRIGADSLKNIKLYATDNYANTYSYEYLFAAERYYYPELVNNWDNENQKPGSGSDAGGVAVEPMFAVSSYQDRHLTDLDHALIGPDDEGSATFRFCFGQTAAELANNTPTNGRFAKWVNKLEIVLPDEPAENPRYEVNPLADDAYTISATSDGIKTMTVKTGQEGLKYFAVSVKVVLAHEGDESLLFTHWRNGTELELNATVADFDTVSSAEAGFNVQAGDVIKVYMVDRLSNDSNVNPVVLQ